MKKEQLIQFLESFAPKNLAMDWDNVGFLLHWMWTVGQWSRQ